MKKRVLVGLMMTMLVGLLSTTALAAGNVQYVDADRNPKTCTNATEIAANDVTNWGAANNTTWYVVNSNVEFTDSITVTGDVHLILANGCELKSTSYITGSGNLTVYSQTPEEGKAEGKLTVNNSKEKRDTPAIGVGSLTVNGGTITAEGCWFWANGNSGNHAIKADTIVINGGNINAKSNAYEGIYARNNGSITITAEL